MKLAAAIITFFFSPSLALPPLGHRGYPKPVSSGFLILATILLLTSSAWSADLRPGDIVTVLPKDAIPAIMSPSFDDADKATWLRSNDVVVGVKIGDDAHVYPISILSRHEIVNDKSGVIPFAVTW